MSKNRVNFTELDSLKRFDEMYQQGGWGGTQENPSSGPGSQKDSITAKFWQRELNAFLHRFPTFRVVELGCGDMELHSTINWGNRGYTCIEISPTIAKVGQNKFPERRILVRDFVKMPHPPKGDVLIIKEVLQHLSNEEINRILSKDLEYYKYIVTMNGCRQNESGDDGSGMCAWVDLSGPGFRYNVIYHKANDNHNFQIIKGK